MRNWIKVLFVLAFASIMSLPYAFADEGCGSMCKCCQGMMGGNMMGMRMMGMREGREGMEMKGKMDLKEMVLHKVMFIMMNAKEINLSDDQMDKIQALKLKVEKSDIMNDAQIDSFALDIKAALSKKDIDVNMLNSLLDKKYDLKKQNAKDFVAAIAELHKILTKDQQDKLKDKWMKHAAGGMGMMMGEGCGMGSKGGMMMNKDKDKDKDKGMGM